MISISLRVYLNIFLCFILNNNYVFCQDTASNLKPLDTRNYSLVEKTSLYNEPIDPKYVIPNIEQKVILNEADFKITKFNYWSADNPYIYIYAKPIDSLSKSIRIDIGEDSFNKLLELLDGSDSLKLCQLANIYTRIYTEFNNAVVIKNLNAHDVKALSSFNNCNKIITENDYYAYKFVVEEGRNVNKKNFIITLTIRNNHFYIDKTLNKT